MLSNNDCFSHAPPKLINNKSTPKIFFTVSHVTEPVYVKPEYVKPECVHTTTLTLMTVNHDEKRLKKCLMSLCYLSLLLCLSVILLLGKPGPSFPLYPLQFLQ